MIDTTELRRLRDAAIEGPLVISTQHMQVMSATTEQFVSCTADDMNDPECLLICYAFNNAHAIADELDELREWKAVEQQHLISSATALLFAGWRGDGSVTDAVKWACGELDALRAENHDYRMAADAEARAGDEARSELDELRKRVAELEALDTQCKIAFAEMWSEFLPDKYVESSNEEQAYFCAEKRFSDGERTTELLAEMQRVTRELTSK